MAIITEYFSVDNRGFTKTYSDSNRYVVRDGISYSEACDPLEYGRTYAEGNEMPTDEIEASEIVSILTGGAS